MWKTPSLRTPQKQWHCLKTWKGPTVSVKELTVACNHAINTTHTFLRETTTLNARLGGTVITLGGDLRQHASIAAHGKGRSIAQTVVEGTTTCIWQQIGHARILLAWNG